MKSKIEKIISDYWYSGYAGKIARLQSFARIMRITNKFRASKEFRCMLIKKRFLISQYVREDGMYCTMI